MNKTMREHSRSSFTTIRTHEKKCSLRWTKSKRGRQSHKAGKNDGATWSHSVNHLRPQKDRSQDLDRTRLSACPPSLIALSLSTAIPCARVLAGLYTQRHNFKLMTRLSPLPDSRYSLSLGSRDGQWSGHQDFSELCARIS